MISMFGPGFDSPQLHKQEKTDTPERGFLFSRQSSQDYMKNKTF